jgi:hypothetical protein
MRFLLLLTMACDPAPDETVGGSETGGTETGGAETGGAETGDTGDTGDTGQLTGAPVTLVFDGLSSLADAVSAPDGSVYASGEGADGRGLYRWDGGLTFLCALTRPGGLAPGTDGEVYAVDAEGILRGSDCGAVEGPAAYAPSAVDLMGTGQGDRLTFGGADPRTGELASWTVKAAGGAVALVGEGYESPSRWLFRPGGETVWTLHDDGALWLVADGSDVATVVDGTFPMGGLSGNSDGTALYFGDGAAIAVYDPATATLDPHALALADGTVVSVQPDSDGSSLLLGVETASGAAVYRTARP